MFTIMPNINKKSDTAIYLQLYQYIKDEIINGNIKKGTKLPSIRGLSLELNLSKTTIENTYQQLLSEGYIEAKDRSGYFVSEVDLVEFPNVEFTQTNISFEKKEYINESIDESTFDFKLWKRTVNKVLNYDMNRLIDDISINGEVELRSEIAKFVREHRGVHCSKDQVIIGAGTQSLLSTLAIILKNKLNVMAYEYPGFAKAKYIFEDYNYKTIPVGITNDGIDIDELIRTNAKVVYVSPTHQYPTSTIMPISNRLKLIEWANNVDGYIMEDDYDGILRYLGNPIPSLQGLSKGRRVIYFGSFSKIFLPSLRISYMILPKELLNEYVKMMHRYTQTVSKIDQLALASYMNDGCFERHIRKIKKIYSKKHTKLHNTIKSLNNPLFEIVGENSGLYVLFKFHNKEYLELIKNKAEHLKLKLEQIEGLENEDIVLFSYSGIKTEQIEDTINMLFE